MVAGGERAGGARVRQERGEERESERGRGRGERVRRGGVRSNKMELSWNNVKMGSNKIE